MPDLTTATQDAVFDVLDSPAMTALAKVFQHVPENTQPPIVVVGDITVEPVGGKDGGLDRMTISVVTLYRGPKRARLYQMQAKVRDLLEGQALPPQVGVALSAPEFVSSDDEILEDGITYLGTQRFALFAQPA